MAVTDLTGTKWRFNESISALNEFSYSLHFTSASLDFFKFETLGQGYYPDTMSVWTLNFQSTLIGDIEAYSNSEGWQDEAYRTIEITGGTDATNADLITWLQENATQVEVTDLSGTKWQSKSTYSATATSTPTVYSINTVNNTGFATDSGSRFLYGAFLKDSGYISSANTVCIADRVYVISPDAWSIEIVDGADVTNPDLIAWLHTNATQIIEPVGNVYELTHSLTNLTHGNVSFTITPDTGYALPSSVTVTDGTLVSYDSSTGVIVVSGDNAEISVSCEATAQSFSTIHLCGVYEAYGYTEYAINSSSAQTVSQANNAGVSRANMTFALAQQYSLTLSDVSSLKIRTFDEYKIYASDGSVIADWSSTMPSSMDSDGFYEFISALSEGCYVCVYYND